MRLLDGWSYDEMPDLTGKVGAWRAAVQTGLHGACPTSMPSAAGQVVFEQDMKIEAQMC